MRSGQRQQLEVIFDRLGKQGSTGWNAASLGLSSDDFFRGGSGFWMKGLNPRKIGVNRTKIPKHISQQKGSNSLLGDAICRG